MAPTFYTYRDLQIAIQTLGEGFPVLLLHGWGGEIASMLPVAQRLAQGDFACHLIDLPGFGQSDTPSAAWTVQDYVDCVLDYIAQHDLQQVHLIGHSFGGRISIKLSAQHPESVKRVVLTDSAGVIPQKTWRSRVYYTTRRTIFTLLKFPIAKLAEPAVRAWFQKRYGSADYQAVLERSPAFAQTFRNVIAEDLVPDAENIQAPTLLIWGELDFDTPLRDAKILEAAIPDAGLVVLDGTGHYAYLERLPDFVRIVSHFLRN